MLSISFGPETLCRPVAISPRRKFELVPSVQSHSRCALRAPHSIAIISTSPFFFEHSTPPPQRPALSQAPGAVSNQTTERGETESIVHTDVYYGHNFLNRGNSLNYFSCQSECS